MCCAKFTIHVQISSQLSDCECAVILCQCWSYLFGWGRIQCHNFGRFPYWLRWWNWWVPLSFWPWYVNGEDVSFLRSFKWLMTCFVFLLFHYIHYISLIPLISVITKEGTLILCVAIGTKIATIHDGWSGADFFLGEHAITFAPFCLVILTANIGDFICIIWCRWILFCWFPYCDRNVSFLLVSLVLPWCRRYD